VVNIELPDVQLVGVTATPWRAAVGHESLGLPPSPVPEDGWSEQPDMAAPREQPPSAPGPPRAPRAPAHPGRAKLGVPSARRRVPVGWTLALVALLIVIALVVNPGTAGAALVLLLIGSVVILTRRAVTRPESRRPQKSRTFRSRYPRFVHGMTGNGLRGRAAETAEREALTGRVAIGMRARNLDPTSPDLIPEAQAWIASMRGSSFHVLRIVCVLEPGQNPTLHTARVRLQLRTTSPGAANSAAAEAVIWSLDPKLVPLGGSRKATREVSGSLKFLSVKVARETDEPSRVAVRGFGELQAVGTWWLTEPGAGGLVGDFEFVAIITRPLTSHVDATMTVELGRSASAAELDYLAVLPPAAATTRLPV
jgi:hypothetical protein